MPLDTSRSSPTRFDSRPEAITADPPPLGTTPLLRQRWAELAYFHWRYEPAAVQATLPDGLRVDTYDGSAWVGLIPFEMRRVRVGPVPAPPPLGDFIEINVRTYVVDELGRRAVWFYSLDVPRLTVVAVARTLFSLPYRWARIHHDRPDHNHSGHGRFGHDSSVEAPIGQRHRYRMARRQRDGHGPVADIDFTVGSAIEPAEETGLHHFLSARWALVARQRGRLVYGRVSHPRWPLHRIDNAMINQNVIEAAGLPTPIGETHTMYSPGVDVELAWFDPIDVHE